MKVIAHHPTTTSVTLWISAGPAERRWSVEVRARRSGRVVDQWSASRRPDRTLPNGIPGLPALCVWRHRISGLTPGEAYDVTVVPTIREERLVARFETLPDELPLRILAAPCYDTRSDSTILSALPLYLPAAVRTGWLAELVRRVRRGVRTLLSALPRRGSPVLLQDSVAQRYRTLYDRPATRPHLKVLMGDQVYLDAPGARVLPTRHPGRAGPGGAQLPTVLGDARRVPQPRRERHGLRRQRVLERLPWRYQDAQVEVDETPELGRLVERDDEVDVGVPAMTDLKRAVVPVEPPP